MPCNRQHGHGEYVRKKVIMSKLHFFVDLKRFDVAEQYGGICRAVNPVEWARGLVKRSCEIGLDTTDYEITYYFPESCIVTAMETLSQYSKGGSLMIGSEGLYRRDTSVGGDYGAMTGTRPASAMVSLGCCHSLVAHSDERRDKLQLMIDYDERILSDEMLAEKAEVAVNKACAEEAFHALNRGMRILFCIGETEQQKGSNIYEEYAPRVKKTLAQQMKIGLGQFKNSKILDSVCLAYEPVWAIGPGKRTPDAEYIGFASNYMKEISADILGRELPIVYGGGIKASNVKEVASVKTIDGGFSGLTTFTAPYRFDADEYKNLLDTFASVKAGQ